MSAQPDGLGSAAHEAARLADALGGWFVSAATDAHDPVTCTACPLCRGIAAVRAVNPEVVEHLTAAAGSLAAALRELRKPTSPEDTP